VEPAHEFWEELSAIIDRHRERPVNVSLDRVSSVPGALELWVWTDQSVRRQGRGEDAVKDVVALADKYQYRVSLVAAPTETSGGPDAEQLAQWYERNEFERTQPGGSVGGIPMLREPRPTD